MALGGMCMKKLVISVLAAIFITVIIPLAIVELTPPRHNADSTEPVKVKETGSVSLPVYVFTV